MQPNQSTRAAGLLFYYTLQYLIPLCLADSESRESKNFIPLILGSPFPIANAHLSTPSDGPAKLPRVYFPFVPWKGMPSAVSSWRPSSLLSAEVTKETSMPRTFCTWS